MDSRPDMETRILLDDYGMYMLERIREARLELKAYISDLRGVKDPSPEVVPEEYSPTEVIEGQTATAEVGEMIYEIIALEGELIHHIGRTIAMADVIPLRQLDWHLHLTEEQLSQLRDLMIKTAPLPEGGVNALTDDDIIEYYSEQGVSFSVGYPPALFIEALYWPQRADHQT
jgi:hypothetical protein